MTVLMKKVAEHADYDPLHCGLGTDKLTRNTTTGTWGEKELSQSETEWGPNCLCRNTSKGVSALRGRHTNTAMKTWVACSNLLGVRINTRYIRTDVWRLSLSFTLYLQWSLRTLYLLVCQVRVAVGNSGLRCCVCVTSFEQLFVDSERDVTWESML